MSDCNFKPVNRANLGIYQKCWKCGLSADAVMASEDSSDECRAAAGAFSNAESFVIVPDVKSIIEHDFIKKQAEEFDKSIMEKIKEDSTDDQEQMELE